MQVMLLQYAHLVLELRQQLPSGHERPEQIPPKLDALRSAISVSTPQHRPAAITLDAGFGQHAPKLADFLTLRARLPRRTAAALQLLLPWHRDTRLAREVLRAVGGTRRRRRHPSPLTPRRPPRWTPDPRSLTRLRGVRCVWAQ